MSVKKETDVRTWIVELLKVIIKNALHDLELIIRWIVIGATVIAFLLGTGAAFRAISLPWPDAAKQVMNIFNGFILVYGGGIGYSMLMFLFWVSLLDWVMERTKENAIRLIRQLVFVVLLIGFILSIFAVVTYGISALSCWGMSINQCVQGPGSLFINSSVNGL